MLASLRAKSSVRSAASHGWVCVGFTAPQGARWWPGMDICGSQYAREALYAGARLARDSLRPQSDECIGECRGLDGSGPAARHARGIVAWITAWHGASRGMQGRHTGYLLASLVSVAGAGQCKGGTPTVGARGVVVGVLFAVRGPDGIATLQGKPGPGLQSTPLNMCALRPYRRADGSAAARSIGERSVPSAWWRPNSALRTVNRTVNPSIELPLRVVSIASRWAEPSPG